MCYQFVLFSQVVWMFESEIPFLLLPAGPLYVMIPPSSSAEILQAMGQSRPIAPKGVPTLLALVKVTVY